MGKNASEKLPRGFLPAWTTRGTALAINVVLLMQLTYYATDVVGLSAKLVGAIMLASKLFDGFTDIIVGFVIDRTKTRWGKARPYELFIIPLWLFTVLLFSTPDIGTTGRAIYIFAFYTLINSVCSTALNGSESVYLSRSLDNQMQQAKTLSGSGVLLMIFAAVGSMILPQLMASWGTQPGGWTKISLVYAIPLSLIGILRFVFIKEKNVEEDDARKLSLKESLGLVVKNKYIFILAIVVLLANLVINIASVVGAYFFSYVIGNLGLLSLVGLTGLLGPFVLLLFPVTMRTIGAMNFIRIGFIVAIVGNIMKFFGSTNVAMVVIGQALAGMGSSTITMMQGLFIIQCMDYGEWKTGTRVEAFLNSVTNFSSKVGSGLASIGVGFIMGLAGYSSSAATQSVSALNSITGLYTLVPAAICILMLISIQFFDLDKKMPEIQMELHARRVIRKEKT